ncbi:phage protease [Algimonas porphyrae]|uniref:Mu-like prophage I protein n=2 Tax=Algimonas porphyrae TaxID=1128113 RepID=A0ABQ5V2P3_9PROT|nr:phage protease [Algimonas porphyrae]GLQ20497.1 hypothetical protein GCM10007854_14520 [Algimonas porphyrae]
MNWTARTLIDGMALALCSAGATGPANDPGDAVRGPLKLPEGLAIARDLQQLIVNLPEETEGDAVSSWNMILPAGEILELRDNRVYRNPDPDALVAAYNADPVDIMVDINHCSVGSEWGPPAEGWVAQMEVRDGAIWGLIDWTDRGLNVLQARHYRYLSPAFSHAEDGEITGFHSVGLVNSPAMTMPAVARSQADGDPTPKPTESLMTEEQLASLREKLGLDADASVDDILAAVAASNEDKPGGGEPGDPADPANPEGGEAGAGAGVDLTDYVPRADYDAVVDRLAETESAGEVSPSADEVEQVIDQAIAAARIAPSSKDHYVAMCATQAGLDSFRKLVKVSPDLVVGKPDASLNKPIATAGSLTAAQQQVCRALGVSEEKFIATNKANQGA